MSRISDLMIDIQRDIELGELSFHQIADKHLVPFSWVDSAAKELMAQYAEVDSYVIENDYFDDYE
jgi:hypothetical protein